MKKISFCDYHEGIRCTDADEEEVSKFYKLILQDEITAVQKNIHAQFILADPMKEFRGKAFWVKCKKKHKRGRKKFLPILCLYRMEKESEIYWKTALLCKQS